MEIELNINNFKEEVNKNETFIVDFYANWCGPCRMLSPVLEDVSNKLNINIGKVNVDENADLAQAFSVSSIPLLLFFKKGELVTQSLGYKDYDEITNIINNLE